MYDVIIAGGGPTGVMLAAELRLHGIEVLVVEAATRPVSRARIVALHIRTLELMAMRGLLDPLVAHGRRRPAAGLFAAIAKPEPTGLDSAHAFLLGIPQAVITRLLEEHAIDLGAQVRHGQAVTGVEQDEETVTVRLADGQALEARYLVGCDGAHSTVRNVLGIDFPGEPASRFTLMGEVEVAAPQAEIAAMVTTIQATNKVFSLGPIGAGLYRAVVPGAVGGPNPPTIEELKQLLRQVAGTDFGVHSPRWLSRFGDATRLVERYRIGRVLLAGDAAHLHPPTGGQGLNLGIQDAVNLGWKLAAQLKGWAPTTLLDSYQAERRPVAAQVLDNTRAQLELLSSEPGAQAVPRLFSELMDIDEVNRRLIGTITAIDIRYDFGADDELVGRRLPDLDLAGGRLYDRLHGGRGLLLDRTGRLAADGWSSRVDLVTDSTAGVDVPGLLLRPDGYVAWVGDEQRDLNENVTRWFGEPA